MKNRIYLILVSLLCTTFASNDAISQCSGRRPFYEVEIECAKKHSDPSYISDGQQYRELFTKNATREFYLPFYGGNKYRIVACTDIEKGAVSFSVKDLEGNVLFTNQEHENSPYWDLEFPYTVDCKIEMNLTPETWKAASGDKTDTSATATAKEVSICATIMIGYKQE